MVRSGTPAAAMQRTAQRLKAFQLTMRPNSSSLISALRGDTRCEEETMAFCEVVMVRLGLLN